MPNTTPETVQPQKVGGFLGWIERIGNKIPDITMLFIAAFFITCIVSMIFSYFTFDYVNPATGKQIAITNMLSPASLVTLMTKMVTNYSGFPPLGMVIVATLGIGIADGSGYINTGLKKILTVTPKFLLTPIVIVVGMLSHLAPDSGYMIIIPIAAIPLLCIGQASSFRCRCIFCRYRRCLCRQLYAVGHRPGHPGLYPDGSPDYRPDL